MAYVSQIFHLSFSSVMGVFFLPEVFKSLCYLPDLLDFFWLLPRVDFLCRR